MANSFVYFAYGSNMLERRILARCPSAKVIGHAYIYGFLFTFEKQGEDQSGKAGLLQTQAPEPSVHGVLYNITMSELPLLDKAEWEGRGYDRHDKLTTTLAATGKMIKASTYVATNLGANLRPFDWYKALVLAGAQEHALPSYWIAKLKAVEAIKDPVSDRKSRLHALELLRS